MCEGYGFKVLNCGSFSLEPNATRKIEIAFTPDFTLSRVERSLLIRTSLGLESGDNEHQDHERGLVKFNLLTTLPAHMLEVCAATLTRPSWEGSLQSTATVLTLVLLICSLGKLIQLLVIAASSMSFRCSFSYFYLYSCGLHRSRSYIERRASQSLPR